MTDTLVPPDTTEHIRDSNIQLIICNDPSTANWEQAVNVEAEVFIGSKYVETKEELAKEYEPYLPVTNMVAAEIDGEIHGSVRFIHYDPEIGFKTLNDAKSGKLQIEPEHWAYLETIDPNDIVEIGTIAVSKEYQTRGPSLKLSQHLYGAIFQLGKQNDEPYVLASFDARYYEGFVSWFGPSVRQLGPAVDYMGSETIPAILDIQEVRDYLAAQAGFEEQVDALDTAGDRLVMDPQARPTQSIS